MSRYVLQCYVFLLSNVVLFCVMLHHGVLCFVRVCYGSAWNAMVCDVVLWDGLVRYVLFCYFMVFCVLVCNVLL